MPRANSKFFSKDQDVCSDVMRSMALKKFTRRWWLVILLSLMYLLSPRSNVNRIPGADLGPHVASVTVQGAVEGMNDSWYRQLEIVANSPQVTGLILIIDSPGGVVSIADAGYSLLKRIHSRVPVVTVIGNTAASAGYLLASTGDVVFARETSIVGSIGVLLEIPVFKELLENVGVDYKNVGVGHNLDAVPFQGLNEFTNKYLELAGNDSYRWFRNVVQYERRLSDQALQKVIGGKIFLGHEALSLGLVDAIGDTSAAFHWLTKQEPKIKATTAVIDYAKFLS